MVGLFLRLPQSCATLSGSTSLNSPWLPCHWMIFRCSLSVRISNRNCLDEIEMIYYNVQKSSGRESHWTIRKVSNGSGYVTVYSMCNHNTHSRHKKWKIEHVCTWILAIWISSTCSSLEKNLHRAKEKNREEHESLCTHKSLLMSRAPSRGYVSRWNESYCELNERFFFATSKQTLNFFN